VSRAYYDIDSSLVDWVNAFVFEFLKALGTIVSSRNNRQSMLVVWCYLTIPYCEQNQDSLSVWNIPHVSHTLSNW